MKEIGDTLERVTSLVILGTCSVQLVALKRHQGQELNLYGKNLRNSPYLNGKRGLVH